MGIPGVPVHDAIMVKVSDWEEALAVIQRHADECLGFVSVLKVTDVDNRRLNQ